MIFEGDWLNPTRGVGLVAYGFAATCCAAAWIRSTARHRSARVATILTIVETFLCLDIAFNWRWTLHQRSMELAQRLGEYEARRLPQLIVILCLAIPLILVLRWSWRRLRERPGAMLAIASSSLSLIVWCMEAISLHAVDHVFYHHLGPVMLVSLLWLSTSVAASIGVLLDAKSESAA